MAAGQGAQRYSISETNPNDSIGGSGCLCSDGMVEDRGGPYAVFSHTTTDNNQSPHVVICAPCVRGVFCAMEDDERERVSLGEPVTYMDITARTDSAGGTPESPTADDFILPSDDELAI